MNVLGETLQDTFTRKGITRRDFMKFCGVMAGALALPKSTADLIARALKSPKRLPVIWLELQDCAGCSEAFLRTPTPTVGELVLDVLSVDYHETIMAASGQLLRLPSRHLWQPVVISWSLKARSQPQMMGVIVVLLVNHPWISFGKQPKTPWRLWRLGLVRRMVAYPKPFPTQPVRWA